MAYIMELLTVALLHFLAVISPGPDFVIVAKNTLANSRKIGIYSALGIMLGMIVHVIYSIVGIGLIISKSIVLFNIAKMLGASYLIYIGFKSFTSRSSSSPIKFKEASKIKPSQAIKVGFFTNALNPKVTLFFLSIFTQFISLDTPLIIKLIYGIEMSVVTLLWFSLIAFLLSHNYIKDYFSKVQNYVEKIMGAILIILGIKIITSEK
jgi:RhtB (resistance to homoserine/threonine) family protein